MNHLRRGVVGVGLGLLLFAVSGCGGGKGLTASLSQDAASALKSEAIREADAPENVKLARKKTKLGSILVTSNPSGAVILLDDKPTGFVTPALLRGIKRKVHTVKVMLGQVEMSREVNLKIDRSIELFFGPLQFPSVEYVTVSPRVLGANGGTVVFQLQGAASGLPVAGVTVAIELPGSNLVITPPQQNRPNDPPTLEIVSGTGTKPAILTLQSPGNNLYARSLVFPNNTSTNASKTYHLTFNVANNVTNELVVPGGDVIVEKSPTDTPPPAPQFQRVRRR